MLPVTLLVVPPPTSASLARTSPMVVRVFVAALCAIVTAVRAVSAAGIPSDPETRASLVGNPTALVVQPVAVALNGPRAMKQSVGTGRYAASSGRDLTSFCEFTF